MTRVARVVEGAVGRAYRYASWRLTGRGLTRMPPIRWMTDSLHRYFEARSGGRIYEVNGFRMVLPETDVGLGIRGFSERFVTDYVQRTVKPGMRLVDVGAHVGYYTLLSSRLVGDSGQVFAFEPEPVNAAMLKENLRLNACSNVVIVPKAVTDRTGVVELGLASCNSGGHAVVRQTLGAQGTSQRIAVDAVSLDHYFELRGVGTVDVIKLDIEGNEYFALKGMIGLLRDNQSLQVVMEYTPELIMSAGASLDAPLRLMTGLGFEIREIGRSIERLSAEALLRKYPAASGRGTMLLFSRPM